MMKVLFSLTGRALLRIFALILPENARLLALRNSPYFDADWYLNTYPDVASAAMDPARHYLDYGADEGRDPGPDFSTSDYRASQLAIHEAVINPLLHFHSYDWLQKKYSRTGLQNELTQADRDAIRNHINSFEMLPLISVVMPVYNAPEKFLRDAINSVISQCYSNWELCIADDASTNPEVSRILKEYAERDSRIRLAFRDVNGNISVATNSAIALASGLFVALMDHDDLLHETALYEVALQIIDHPEVDVIYSDEDTINQAGVRCGGYLKTDFNPELFLGHNMINHLGVYRQSLLKDVGGLRVGFEGSQDYDLALRIWAASSTDRIRHIPSVLYHWRRGAILKTFSEAQLEKCILAARRAIQEYLDLEGEGAKVVAAPGIDQYSRVVRKIPEPKPLVSIIIPTKDRADLLSVCIDGILNKTDYPTIELLIVDHESEQQETFELFGKIASDPRVRILPYSGAFNYSAINNAAVKQARGDIIAFINNDIEVIEPDWLTEMVSHAVRPQIGAVGAKLLYPDGRIQHAGVVLGYGGSAGHSFAFAKRNAPCYFGFALLARAVSAVTGACLVVRKSVFAEVAGFDEVNLPVAFNDVDLCLKIQAKGYRNVWTPFAQLLHHESASRGHEDTPRKRARVRREITYLQKTWSDLIRNDPFYNPNLSLKNHNYQVASPSRRPKPWRAAR